MTLDLTKWDERKTIIENADILGVDYGVAYRLSRKHRLKSSACKYYRAKKERMDLADNEINPAECIKQFAERDWRKIVKHPKRIEILEKHQAEQLAKHRETIFDCDNLGDDWY